MDWNDFFKSVKEGRFHSVYLFTGPEELTKKEALAALRKAVLPAGLEQLNDVTLEGVDAQAIIDCAETLPVMCERRIVVVRNWQPLLPGKGKKKDDGADEKDGSADKDTARMLEWLKNPPESCILVFYMTIEPNSSKKLVTTLKKVGCQVEFKHLSGAALQKWCAQQLKSSEKRIAPEAVDELSLMAGQDLTRLAGELRKLAAYIGDRTEVQVEDVQAIVSPSAEYSVFTILDHLLQGRLADATQVVNSVLQTEPNVVRLISLIGNQLRIDTHMKYALDARKPMPEVLAALGVNEKRAWHIQRQVRAHSAEALKARYLCCVEADYAIKSGKLRDRAALDALMLKLSEK